jgi:hypothetical protein
MSFTLPWRLASPGPIWSAGLAGLGPWVLAFAGLSIMDSNNRPVSSPVKDGVVSDIYDSCLLFSVLLFSFWFFGFLPLFLLSPDDFACLVGSCGQGVCCGDSP